VPPATFAESAVAAGAAVAVVTRGSDGAVAACAAGGSFEVAAVPVRVVDTVGAGDAYMSALLAGLHDRGLLGAGRRDSLRAIDGETLHTVLRTAALAAAITCGRRGSDPPTGADLDALAARR
jgi:fructokinase